MLSDGVPKDQFANFIRVVDMVNLVLPPLWMAGCAQSIIAGTWHFVWLTIAMFAVAFLSLRRNYRQTLRFYLGETDSRANSKQREATQVAIPSMPPSSATISISPKRHR